MDTYDVGVFLDRLAAAMKARKVAEKAREAYGYRYAGCHEAVNYGRAKERLAETLTLLINSGSSMNHQSEEG